MYVYMGCNSALILHSIGTQAYTFTTRTVIQDLVSLLTGAVESSRSVDADLITVVGHD